MQHAANVTSGDVLDWHAIDWKSALCGACDVRYTLHGFSAGR